MLRSLLTIQCSLSPNSFFNLGIRGLNVKSDPVRTSLSLRCQYSGKRFAQKECGLKQLTCWPSILEIWLDIMPALPYFVPFTRYSCLTSILVCY